jgi:hypothetical protein
MEPASTRRRIAVVAMTVWLVTLGMDAATSWVVAATDYLERINAAGGVPSSSDQVLVTRVAFIVLCAVTVGYVTVGALLAGRGNAGRIAGLLLAGGALMALVLFGLVVGSSLAAGNPGSRLFGALLVIGFAAIGPAFATILPGLAIAFPDGRLPSRRWRWPVGIAAGLIGIGTSLQLVRPGPIVSGLETRNPFGLDSLPTMLRDAAVIAVLVSTLALTAFGVVAVIVRYRRGDAVERQQQRWFLAAVSVAAVPVALSTVPGISGPQVDVIAAGALTLVPIAVAIAVTRYRLYEIDHLINRTLVYVPLTALLAGLYAATVALLQRVFQSVTGDKSDAAIIISTLILASVFTPLRKWLEGIVERRFKPATRAIPADPSAGSASSGPEWEARVAAVALQAVRAAKAPELDAHIAAIALQVMRAELDARAVPERPAKSGV